MPDRVVWGTSDILDLIPEIERSIDVIEPRIRRYGDRTELKALITLNKNLAEIERISSDLRRGLYRKRGETRT